MALMLGFAVRKFMIRFSGCRDLPIFIRSLPAFAKYTKDGIMTVSF